MAFVIAEPCVSTCDTACVSVCPPQAIKVDQSNVEKHESASKSL